MKFCPYCGASHSRRGKYCDPIHTKRAAAQLSTFSRQRNSARRRSLALAQERCRYARTWAQIALGSDDGSGIAAIFDPDTRRKRAKRIRAANPAPTLARTR